jgi:hypothetical protein
MTKSNFSKYFAPSSCINFIISPCLITIFYWLKRFFFIFNIDNSTALWSMSIISAMKEIFLSEKYFERASPIAPLPQPNSKNLKGFSLFSHYSTLFKNLGSSQSIAIICSVSNLGMSIGGLSFSLRSKNGHSLHIYWTGK